MSFSRAAFGLGLVSLTPRLSAGWVREWADDALAGQSFRVEGAIDSTFPSASFLGLTATETAGVRLTLYEAGDASRTRAAFAFTSSLGSPGMRLSWTGQLVAGSSPFEYDAAEAASRLAWRFSGQAGAAVAVEGAVDLLEGTFDPLVVRFDYGQTPSLGLVARCDLATGSVAQVTLSGRWKVSGLDAAWEVPYLPALARFDPAVVQLRATAGAAKVGLRAEIDPVRGRLVRASAEAEVRSEIGWGLTASASAVDGTRGLVNPTVGVFRDLYDCLRLGIERKSGQIWVYVSVLAFPEAVLRYAPGGGVTLGS